MATFGFSEGDAKRIGKAVRVVERLPSQFENTGPLNPEVSRGVRLLIGQVESTAGWAKGSTAVVKVYTGTNPASAMTVVARNQFLTFSTSTACTQKWVALGHNGWGWYAVAQEPVCTATCTMEFAGIDFSALPNFNASTIQLLGHNQAQTHTAGTDAYCSNVASLRWYDVTTCSTAA